MFCSVWMETGLGICGRASNVVCVVHGLGPPGWRNVAAVVPRRASCCRLPWDANVEAWSPLPDSALVFSLFVSRLIDSRFCWIDPMQMLFLLFSIRF